MPESGRIDGELPGCYLLAVFTFEF